MKRTLTRVGFKQYVGESIKTQQLLGSLPKVDVTGKFVKGLGKKKKTAKTRKTEQVRLGSRLSEGKKLVNTQGLVGPQITGQSRKTTRDTLTFKGAVRQVGRGVGRRRI